MAFRTGTADDYLHLLKLLRSYIRGWARETSRSFTGTGNGTLTRFTLFQNQAETWTITFTSATAFGVVGSVSGSIGTGVVGTMFVHAKLEFLITAGGTAFVNTDAFAVVVAATNLAGGDIWTEDRFTGDYSSAPLEFIAHGPGSGSDAVYVGIQTGFNVTGDWYNWRLAGFTGYNGGNTYDNQPGSSEIGQTSPIHLPLWNQAIGFWFVVSGRRIIVVAKVSTAYVTMYLGFLNAYATPGQYPYPLVVGGSLAYGNNAQSPSTSSNWRWSSSFARAFWDADTFGGSVPASGKGPLRLRLAGGGWRDFYAKNNGTNLGASLTTGTQHYAATSLATFNQLPQDAVDGVLWPSAAAPSGWADALDGSKFLLPSILGLGVAKDPPDGDLMGELDGVARLFTTGISAEQTVGIGGTDWLIIPDVSRSSNIDYAAIKLA